MNWTELLLDSKPVMRVFATAPSLQHIRVRELCLHEDGPCMALRLDLKDFPEDPPEKWKVRGFNRVQLTLRFIDVDELLIQGWGRDNIVDLKLTPNGDGSRMLSVQGDDVQIDCRARFVQVERISAYHDADESE